ncbi:MAG: DUF5655 domain-containing protein [Xanthomonadales bacterium]|jgi:hypothetical protein|nr:DUF5655 domain-containing protein [Xanthomonadales bacterium]
MSSAEAMAARMEANIAENTGKTVEEWVATVKATGLEKHGQIVKMLKTDHGFTHGYANLVAHRTLQSSHVEASDDDLVAAQYDGPKADLKPVYEAIMNRVRAFGDGLEVAPKKAYISLRHKKQFALVQPSTRTRVDVGINLKDREPEGRLEASGSFNAMVSHRVRLGSVEEVDDELEGWLREAFDAAG